MKHLPKPDPALKLLNFLIGKWQSEGEARASSTDPAVKITGTDNYEWISGGFFILHRVDVMMGDKKTEVIEIIGGYDPASKTYLMRSFDNQGNFAVMHAHVNQDGLLQITGDKMRSELSVNDDGNRMAAHWERSEDGETWLPWMDIKFTK